MMRNHSKTRWTTFVTCFLAGLLVCGLGICQESALEVSEDHAQKTDRNFHLTIQNGKISLVAQNAPLRDIFMEMGRQARTNMVVGPQVRGSVTARFEGLTLEQAIKKIAKNWGIIFTANSEGEGYNISYVIVPESAQPSETSPLPFQQTHPLQDAKTGSQHSGLSKENHGRTLLTQRFASTEKTGKTPAKDRFVPGELLVRFQGGLSNNDIKTVLAVKKATVKKVRARANYHVLSLPPQLPVTETAAWFKSQETVVFAEPNYLLRSQATPDDSRYSDQWALANIDAEPAWNLETGHPGVAIAIIDTGVDYIHSDLYNNLWKNPGEIPNNGIDDDENGYVDDDMGWDFVEDASDCNDDDCDTRDRDPMDDQGHGTHVAGIAGAVTDNGVGIAGVAWNCTIMAVRAGYKDTDGRGSLEVDDAAEAIYYAVDNGAQVLNLSWGGTSDFTPVRNAIQYASNKGVLICAAAGNNSNSTKFYPAAYSDPMVLAIGSTTSSNVKASSSNYGSWVDVSAPGNSIISTCIDDISTSTLLPEDNYCYKSGTSMASPHAAGLAALLFARFPGWSAHVIRDMILDSVFVVEALDGKNATSGIINLMYALEISYNDVNRFMENLSGSLGQTGCNDGVFCEGDVDGDGDVDGSDMAAMLTY